MRQFSKISTATFFQPAIDGYRGWDQTGSNGANLSFPLAFDIWEGKTFPDNDPRGRGGQDTPDAETNQWLVGVINAGPYIASAFLCVQVHGLHTPG